MSEVSKSRDWVFTINNYNEDTIRSLKSHNGKFDYIIFGREVGAMGTPHLQGFCQFNNPVSFSKAKRDIGWNAHVESRKGSVSAAIEYCKKDGDFYSQGDPQRLSTSKDLQQSKWKQCIELAEQSNLNEIKLKYPSEYIRYFKTFCSLQKGSSTILSEISNEWWYGPTGTGKSMKAWQDYPDHYQKELNKWWDNYTGQEVVVIEEWCPKNECTASQLKIWSDRYPFTAQIKGGTLQRIRPKKIIITSNYTIDQCFTNVEDADPIKRRFTEIYFPFQARPPMDIDINLDFLEELDGGGCSPPAPQP